MLKLCTDCYEVFKAGRSGARCPQAECAGILVEIDEQLINVVRRFWQLGIGTRSCCAGHLDSNCFSPYIVFDQTDGSMASLVRLRESLDVLICGEEAIRVEDLACGDSVLIFKVVVGVEFGSDLPSQDRLRLQREFIDFLYSIIDGIEVILAKCKSRLFERVV